MCKKRFIAMAFGVLLTVSIIAQTNNQNGEDQSKAGFFFGAGLSNGFFPSGPIKVYSDFEIEMLSPIKAGAYYELPLGIGNFFAGLEGGYASKSLFGGGGDVNFLPINLNATLAFNIADILYIGPGIKLGALGLLGHNKYSILPLLGVGLDVELRYPYFPLSVYVTGGVNAYPTTYKFNVLPTVELGLRFPRGAFGKSAANAGTSGSSTTTGLTAGQSGQTTGTPPAASQPPVTAPPVISAPPASQVRTPFQFTPTDNSRIITLDNGSQGLFSSVYFEPDTGVLIERYRPIMEEAGRLLAANPGLQLLLRTYTAPFGTADGRYMVSMERGNFCRDYFVQNYGISPSRISIEPYGSEREPVQIRTDDWVSYRCAELIITE